MSSSTCSEDAGEQVLSSDSEGLACLHVTDEVSLSDGDTLHATAYWVGPTRETLEQTLLLSVVAAPLRLRLSTTPYSPVPGAPFWVHVEAEGTAGESISGQQVLSAYGLHVVCVYASLDSRFSRCMDCVLPI